VTRPYVIGIAGGSGSGKTTMLRMLREQLTQEQVTIISQDDYYHPVQMQVKDSQGKVNFDLPSSIDSRKLLLDLDTLMSGGSVSIPRYAFNNDDEQETSLVLLPRPVIIIEGLFVFHYPQLQGLIDYRVFVHAPADIRLARRLDRDGRERGYGPDVVQYQWKHHVQPAYERFLLPHKNSAHELIDNELDMVEQVAQLSAHIAARLERKPVPEVK